MTACTRNDLSASLPSCVSQWTSPVAACSVTSGKTEERPEFGYSGKPCSGHAQGSLLSHHNYTSHANTVPWERRDAGTKQAWIAPEPQLYPPEQGRTGMPLTWQSRLWTLTDLSLPRGLLWQGWLAT